MRLKTSIASTVAVLAFASGASGYSSHRAPRLARFATYSAFAPTFSGPTLITPTGQRVGGQLQRWADRMHTPAWQGDLVIDPDVTICAQPFESTACAPLTDNTIHFPATGDAHTEFAFYHELGHKFDERYLTDADHRILIRWLSQDVGGGLTQWWRLNAATSEQENFSGAEYFANAYATCAQNDRVNEDQRICLYLGGLATRVRG